MEAKKEMPKHYGILARFDTPEALVEAANKSREAGYREMEGYTPFPIHDLHHALGKKNSMLPWLVFFGGVIGAISGYGLEYVTSVIEYPVNIGGRPLNSIPQFIPVAFECTILFASLTSAVGMLFLNGLPTPYHALFNVKDFLNASRDKFYLCIEANDPKFDVSGTTSFMRSLNPEEVYEVEP